MQINLVHLYPNLLNIYGDRGNIQTLIYRCQKRNIKVNLKTIKPQDPLPLGSFDLLFAGGGQDQQQLIVEKDLQKRKTVLTKAALNHIPMLTICGSYQLFGQYFKTFDNQKIKGIGIFDAYTVASKKRKIGNVTIKTSLPLKIKTMVGFENHSGNTFLQSPTKPLGKVVKGFGNNGEDKTEGATKNNVFG
ncbi:type 1 glutamine amidotransferase, partial [Patescibacteria group bacterium]